VVGTPVGTYRVDAASHDNWLEIMTDHPHPTGSPPPPPPPSGPPTAPYGTPAAGGPPPPPGYPPSGPGGPFGPGGPSGPGGPFDPGGESGPGSSGAGGGRNRTGLLIGGAVAALALVGGGIYALTQGGDDESGDDTEITIPEGTGPDLSIPDITMPDVTVPDVSAPDFTIPDLTAPDLTAPDLTVPDLTVPDVTVPTDISVPSGAFPEPSVEPTGLGSDAELDVLAEQCYLGGLIACDELFAVSESASAYEDYGDTCAGRQEAGTGKFCSALADFPEPAAGPDTLPDDDPMLLDAARCWAGVMPFCDLLAQSGSAGAMQDYGTSCAGRQPAGTGGCPAAFPEWEALYAPTTTPATSEPGSDPATSDEAGEPTSPDGLGSDPAMDELAQSCFDGDFVACDDLFWESPVDSAYEDYASMCGGRFPEPDHSGLCESTFG